MINVLIPTKPRDAHAIFVKLALEKKGHTATLWYTGDVPELQTHSFQLKNDEIIWQASGKEFYVSTYQRFNVVWLRRPAKPILPEYLHEHDMMVAQKENDEFYRYFWQVIALDAKWVNPVKCITAANCKLLQLKEANALGLTTPDSLFSNDPEDIKVFINNHGDNEVIYKPIYPVHWLEEDGIRLTYTSEVSIGMLPADRVLQATPGIYQKKIHKAYELRVTMMGQKAIAVKIDSQAHPHAKMDWRSVSGFEINMQEVTLPDEIYAKCLSLMNRLGLVFGCLDFIVTPGGEYYFLEVNEQGQFLWIEEVNPSIKILDAFVNFLIEQGGENPPDTQNSLSLADFNAEMLDVMKHAEIIHKDTGAII